MAFLGGPPNMGRGAVFCQEPGEEEEQVVVAGADGPLKVYLSAKTAARMAQCNSFLQTHVYKYMIHAGEMIPRLQTHVAEFGPAEEQSISIADQECVCFSYLRLVEVRKGSHLHFALTSDK